MIEDPPCCTEHPGHECKGKKMIVGEYSAWRVIGIAGRSSGLDGIPGFMSLVGVSC